MDGQKGLGGEDLHWCLGTSRVALVSCLLQVRIVGVCGEQWYMLIPPRADVDFLLHGKDQARTEGEEKHPELGHQIPEKRSHHLRCVVVSPTKYIAQYIQPIKAVNGAQYSRWHALCSVKHVH